MARRHLDMGVPFFIDRELSEVANPRDLQVGAGQSGAADARAASAQARAHRTQPMLVGSPQEWLGTSVPLARREYPCLTCPRPGFLHPRQDLLPFLPGLNPLDLLGQHDRRLQQFFKDPRLRAMFTFQARGAGMHYISQRCGRPEAGTHGRAAGSWQEA